MSRDYERFRLSAAGYLLLTNAANSSAAVENRGTTDPYAGVDRIPPLIALDDIARQKSRNFGGHDVSLGTVIDEWLDSRFGNTAFIPSHARSLQLLDAFESFGWPLDLVFCQVAWNESKTSNVHLYGPADEVPPVISVTYGFDVSWPTCNHSAIRQPGIVPTSLTWRKRLNQFGLLTDYEEADVLRNEYLVAYPYPPFEIYLVHKVAVKGELVQRV
jgi:hypothetical protein